MDLNTITWVVVGATFLLYVVIAIAARAGNTNEFYVAGKGINPVLNGMATAADWMSAASFISMAGLIAFNGYDASATASCFVMQCVELSAQKDRREKQQAELSYEELNAVWLRYLSTSVASPV